jgi:hypothetical protein
MKIKLKLLGANDSFYHVLVWVTLPSVFYLLFSYLIQAKTEEDLAALESEINNAVQSASRSASPRKSKGGGNDDDSDEEEVHHTGGGGVSDLLETIEALTVQLNESETERELQASAVFFFLHPFP